VTVVSARSLVHEDTLEVVPHFVVLLRLLILDEERTHVELKRVRDGVSRLEAGQFLHIPLKAHEREVKDLWERESGERREGEVKRTNGRKGGKATLPAGVLLAIARLAEVPVRGRSELAVAK